MQIELNPFDTLFFRDGKPFERGDEVWANGLFPPAPSVVYGALRTVLMSQNLDWLNKAGGPEDLTQDLRIKALLIKKGSELFLPCPYDVVDDLKKTRSKPLVLSLQEKKMLSSYPSKHVLIPPPPHEGEVLETCGGTHMLAESEFNTYLKGETPFPTAIDVFVEKEPKIGIQKNAETGSSAEGMLYRVELLRLKEDVGFYVDIILPHLNDKTSFPLKGLINIGGEGKSMAYSTAEQALNIRMPKLEGTRFKVVVCSPACFEQGWLPGGINNRTLEGTWRGQRVKILAAAMERSTYLGGFAMKTKHQAGGPKPMRRALPAGTVYYIELLEGTIEAAAAAFHGQCISEFGLDKEGFGLAFVGAIK